MNMVEKNRNLIHQKEDLWSMQKSSIKTSEEKSGGNIKGEQPKEESGHRTGRKLRKNESSK